MENLFVRRPILALVISIVITLVGAISILGISLEQYPSITPPVVQVSGNYTGADALIVEQTVATPIEQEMNGVENMIYMKSTNTSAGTMTLTISFEVGTNPDMNTVFAQNRTATATPKVPEEVRRIGLNTKKAFTFPLLLIAITGDGKELDQNFLGNYASINIKDELARVPGVGKVDVLGSSEYSMRLWVNPARLSQLNISIPEIVAAVKAQNAVVPGGKFGAEPAPPGTEFTYTVRMPSRLQSEAEFGDIVVRTNPDGSRILVKDLARVELGVETYNAISRTDGQPSALLAIYQAPGTNAVETAEELRGKMEILSQSFPDGMAWNVPMDTTLAITAGIEEIVITLFEALALVILVVFLFIQDWRATLIPSLAIPVSLIGAFMLFPVLGFSINVLSLLGLVLAIGIVVDDAIVVVEAVQVKMEEGLSPKEATTAAMKEVTAPVIATTLVLVAVFVPVAAMGGITGRLYQQFAITIAVSTVFSSINALSLSPALCSLLLKPKKPQHERKGLLGRFFNGFDRWFDRSTGGYMKWASWMGTNTKRGLLFLAIFTIMAGFLGSLVPGGFIPEEDQGYIMVNYQLPDAASMQRSDEVAKQVEAILAQQPEIEHYANITGFSLLSGSFSSNVGFVFIGLKEWADRDATAKEVANRLSGIMAREVKSAIAFAFGPPAIPGLGNGSGFSIMIQDKGGNTPEYLAEYARTFATEAMKRPEIGNAYTTFTPNVPQRKIELDRDKILKAGLDLNEIYATTAAFLGGTYVNDFNRFGRLYKAYIQAEPEFRQTPDQLNLFFVRNKEGERVPLASFLKVTETYGPEYTYRYNLYRSAEVSGVPAPGFSSTQALDALEEVAAEVLPPDMGYSWSNMSYQEREAGGAGSIVFVFALIFVFLILSAQYESWSLPFAVLLGTPLAMLGAFAFLTIGRFLSDSYENNVFVQISLVMLIAMGAKNAILIVEFAHLEFQKGKGLFDAAMDAAKLRFRPILMTAFSFILGVLPLVTAVGAGAEARKVMGLALLGGMGVATMLGVFFYPMFYVVIGKWAGYERKREQGHETTK